MIKTTYYENDDMKGTDSMLFRKALFGFSSVFVLTVIAICCSVFSTPVVAFGQDQVRQTQIKHGVESSPLGSQYIPFDGVLAAVVRPADLMASESMELYPTEVADAWCLDTIGCSLNDCESLRLVIGTPGPNGPLGGLVVKFNKPIAVNRLNAEVVDTKATLNVDDRTCYRVVAPFDLVLHQPDDQTFVIAVPTYLSDLMSSAEGNEDAPLGKLAEQTSGGGEMSVLFSVTPVRPMLSGLLRIFANQVPTQLQDALRLPEMLNAVVIKTDLGNSEKSMTMELQAADDESAQKIDRLIKDALQMGRQIAMAKMEEDLEDGEGYPEATRAYANRIADQFAVMLKPQRDGDKLTYSGPIASSLAANSVLVAALLPAIKAARDAAARAGQK